MSVENNHSSVIPESPNNLQLKEALMETLKKASDAGIDLYLTGGTAAAVYAGETRPLSLDLDFFVHPDAKEKIQRVFGGSFKYFGEKKLFKSDKLVGKASNGVDLDFIAEQNIVPDETSPEGKITLCLNDFARSKSCENEFMGEKIKVLPPELVVVAKLFAGRGKELGKYDLDDSKAVIESGIIRPEIFKRAVASIVANNENIAPLVYSRLTAGLSKLSSSAKVEVLIKALRELGGIEETFPIDQITQTLRDSILPEG